MADSRIDTLHLETSLSLSLPLPVARPSLAPSPPAITPPTLSFSAGSQPISPSHAPLAAWKRFSRQSLSQIGPEQGGGPSRAEPSRAEPR